MEKRIVGARLGVGKGLRNYCKSPGKRNNGRTYGKPGKGSRVREVSGDSQELMLVLDEWVTEKRSEPFRSRLRWEMCSVLCTLGLVCTWRWV